MQKRKLILVLCFLLVLPAFLYSQTAQRIETLLSSDALSYGQVVQFVLEAADLSGFASPQAAFYYAAEQNWLPRNVTAGDLVTLNGLSFLIMQAFEIRGGIFYSLFRNPHYAYRELVHRNIILGRIDPGMFVSGDTLLYVVNRVIAFQESNLL